MNDLLAFEDVPIVPFARLPYKNPGRTPFQGGPCWPEWDRQTVARHCQRGVPVDTRPEDAACELTLDEPVAWAGAATAHFGHQVADFSTRILPTLREWPEATFAFAVRTGDGINSLAETPRFFREILEWFSVPPERVRILSRPTLARRVLVAPQAEQVLGLGEGPPVPRWYLDALGDIAHRRLGRVRRGGTVFVSRSRQIKRLAGEVELETALARCGVEVFRPEEHPLPTQLARYAGADRLIFSEGSAVLGLQLLGGGLGEVHLLGRRPGSKMGKWFLPDRARRVEWIDIGCRLVCGESRFGTRIIHRGMPVPDEQRLLDAFRGMGIPVASHWDSSRYRTACENDLRLWLEKNGWQAKRSESAEAIRTSLAECGFGHLWPG